MTPREKAIKLVKKFDELLPCEGTTTGQTPIDCALIAVDEIINMCKLYHNHNVVINTKIFTELTIEYYQEVKQEIQKL